MNLIQKNSPKSPLEIRKIKINPLVQLFVYYCRYHSSLSVLCLLPMGLPCLERLLTDDLSSILIVGDNGIIFRVPLGVGTIHALKLQIAMYQVYRVFFEKLYELYLKMAQNCFDREKTT